MRFINYSAGEWPGIDAVRVMALWGSAENHAYSTEERLSFALEALRLSYPGVVKTK